MCLYHFYIPFIGRNKCNLLNISSGFSDKEAAKPEAEVDEKSRSGLTFLIVLILYSLTRSSSSFH